MIIGDEIFTRLSADVPLRALIGAPPDTRVYPQVLPQGEVRDSVVFNVITDVPQNSLLGYTSGLRSVRVQLDCYAGQYRAAQLLANAVQAVLGSVISGPLKSVQVDRRDLYDDATRLRRVMLDYQMWMEE